MMSEPVRQASATQRERASQIPNHPLPIDFGCAIPRGTLARTGMQYGDPESLVPIERSRRRLVQFCRY